MNALQGNHLTDLDLDLCEVQACTSHVQCIKKF